MGLIPYPDLELALGDGLEPALGDVEWAVLELALRDVEWAALELALGDVEWAVLEPALGDVEWAALELALGDVEWAVLEPALGDVEWAALEPALGDVEWAVLEPALEAVPVLETVRTAYPGLEPVHGAGGDGRPDREQAHRVVVVMPNEVVGYQIVEELCFRLQSTVQV